MFHLGASEARRIDRFLDLMERYIKLQEDKHKQYNPVTTTGTPDGASDSLWLHTPLEPNDEEETD